MKLISLNTWDGKLKEELFDFINSYRSQVDLYCFQEIYDSPVVNPIARGMVSTLFSEISKLLPNHTAHFAPYLKGYDIDGKVNFELLTGNSIFISKSLSVSEVNDIFLFRDRFDALENGNYIDVPRNLQYTKIKQNTTDYLISHFHGVWFPKTKLDNPDRIKQSNIIISFYHQNQGKKVLCGDFNLMPNTQSLKIIEKEMRNLITEFNITTTRNKNYVRSEKFADYICF